MSTRTSKVYILVNDLGIVLDVTSNVKKLYEAHEKVFQKYAYSYQKLLEAMDNNSLHLKYDGDIEFVVLKRQVR